MMTTRLSALLRDACGCACLAARQSNPTAERQSIARLRRLDPPDFRGEVSSPRGPRVSARHGDYLAPSARVDNRRVWRLQTALRVAAIARALRTARGMYVDADEQLSPNMGLPTPVTPGPRSLKPWRPHARCRSGTPNQHACGVAHGAVTSVGVAH